MIEKKVAFCLHVGRHNPTIAYTFESATLTDRTLMVWYSPTWFFCTYAANAGFANAAATLSYSLLYWCVHEPLRFRVDRRNWYLIILKSVLLQTSWRFQFSRLSIRIPGVVFPSLATWGVEFSCFAFLHTFLVSILYIIHYVSYLYKYNKKIKFLIFYSQLYCANVVNSQSHCANVVI